MDTQERLQMEKQQAEFQAKKPETPKAKNLYQKLAEVVTAIDHVEKMGYNDFQRYNYVKAADIARAVRAELSSRQIYLISTVEEIRNYTIPAKEGVMQAVDVKMKFVFVNAEAGGAGYDLPMDRFYGETMTMIAWGTGTDKGDKAVYKAMTGALKYGLRNAFLIPDESDPEGDTRTDKATAAQEVGKKKIEELTKKLKGSIEVASATTPALFYVWHDESQTAEITGLESLKTAHKDLLKPLWNGNARAIIANAEQLENLKYELEQRKVEFRPLKATV